MMLKLVPVIKDVNDTMSSYVLCLENLRNSGTEHTILFFLVFPGFLLAFSLSWVIQQTTLDDFFELPCANQNEVDAF